MKFIPLVLCALLLALAAPLTAQVPSAEDDAEAYEDVFQEPRVEFECNGGVNARAAAAFCCRPSNHGVPGENAPAECVHNWCVRQCCLDVYGTDTCSPNGNIPDAAFTACMAGCGPVAAQCTCGGRLTAASDYRLPFFLQPAESGTGLTLGC